MNKFGCINQNGKSLTYEEKVAIGLEIVDARVEAQLAGRQNMNISAVALLCILPGEGRGINEAGNQQLLVDGDASLHRGFIGREQTALILGIRETIAQSVGG